VKSVIVSNDRVSRIIRFNGHSSTARFEWGKPKKSPSEAFAKLEC
jgi:hypothetical protein